MIRRNFLYRYCAALALIAGAIWHPSGAAEPEQRFLASTEWVASHRSDADVRVLDLRSEHDYLVNHIEGAVNLPIDRLFINENGKRYIGRLPQVQAAFSAAGIDKDTQVVVYDNGDFLSSARAFWVFEAFGHSRVTALDGGFKAWQQMNLPVSNQVITPSPRNFIPSVAADRLATKLSTRLAVDSRGTTIIDARDAPEYRGEKSLAQRFGHIPSAVNIPAMNHFDTRNGIRYLKSTDELAAVFKSVDHSQKVVTYCNTGVLSATTYFVLRQLGYDVANYDGSWVEWGNDTSLPITAPQADAPGAPNTADH